MTTQQEQPQTEQQEQPTPSAETQPPRAEDAESLGRQMGRLEVGVEQLDRRLDDTNRSHEGLRAEMNAKFAEQRTETRESFAELRADMRRMEARLERLFNLAVIGLSTVIAALIALIGAIIVATILN